MGSTKHSEVQHCKLFFIAHEPGHSRNSLQIGDYSQTIAQVLIDVAPGSQITYNPYNPPKVSAQELAGQLHGMARFWMTDDKNRAVNTNGESWSLRVVVSYI